MKIHPVIAAAGLGIIIALQGWTLSKVSDLSSDVAVLKFRVSQLQPTLGALK